MIITHHNKPDAHLSTVGNPSCPKCYGEGRIFHSRALIGPPRPGESRQSYEERLDVQILSDPGLSAQWTAVRGIGYQKPSDWFADKKLDCECARPQMIRKRHPMIAATQPMSVHEVKPLLKSGNLHLLIRDVDGYVVPDIKNAVITTSEHDLYTFLHRILLADEQGHFSNMGIVSDHEVINHAFGDDGFNDVETKLTSPLLLIWMGKSRVSEGQRAPVTNLVEGRARRGKPTWLLFPPSLPWGARHPFWDSELDRVIGPHWFTLTLTEPEAPSIKAPAPSQDSPTKAYDREALVSVKALVVRMSSGAVVLKSSYKGATVEAWFPFALIGELPAGASEGATVSLRIKRWVLADKYKIPIGDLHDDLALEPKDKGGAAKRKGFSPSDIDL
jgi:hypothetical protein